MTRKEHIRQLLVHLQHGIYEKEEAIRLALLAALAGESIFLLGPPGVAKSLIARKLKFAFRDGKSFEYLMNRFSTPDEIFGPVSIRKLREEDRYERLTDQYLPGANVVFLDEIWKAGPAIQNALLTVLNEKIYRNGEQEIPVQIRAVISASNELPSEEGFHALWDRFLIRYWIHEIRQSGHFLNMITDTANVYEDTIPDALKLPEETLVSWEPRIDAIGVPPEVLNVIQVIRHRLETYDHDHPDRPFRIYDRRWKKIVRLLRTSAFLNERPDVDLMDCFLLPHALWGYPEHLEVAQEIVAETIRKHGYNIALNIHALRQEIRDLEAEVNQEIRIPNVVLTEVPRAIDREWYEVQNASQYFEGNRIKRADFDRLTVDEDTILNLYDALGNLVSRLKARKVSDVPHSLSISHNSRTYTFMLVTNKVEKTEYLYKKPHALVQQYWNDRLQTLHTYITTQQNEVHQQQPDTLPHLRTNLFVAPAFAELVEANLRESLVVLDELQLQLDKIRHLYQTL